MDGCHDGRKEGRYKNEEFKFVQEWRGDKVMDNERVGVYNVRIILFTESGWLMDMPS